LKIPFINKNSNINTKLLHLDSKILVPEEKYIEDIINIFKNWVEKNKFNLKNIFITSTKASYRESGVFCSFCGEKNSDENIIIYSENASICQKCIDLCIETISNNTEGKDKDN